MCIASYLGEENVVLIVWIYGNGGLGGVGEDFLLGFQAWFDMFLDIRSLDLREALNNYLADFSAKG